MNEESENAGGSEGQDSPPSSESGPADQPASPNQEQIKKGEMELEELTGRVIGCAIAVHRELGPGFLETIYENALIVELRHMEIPFQAQGERPIFIEASWSAYNDSTYLSPNNWWSNSRRSKPSNLSTLRRSGVI